MKRNARKRRGAALVEFAVVAPLLFLFILALFEFGRMVMVQHVLVSAARIGCRQATLATNHSNSTIETNIRNMLVDGGIPASVASNTSLVVVAITDTTNPSGEPSKTVSISVPFAEVSWLPSGAFDFLGATRLEASASLEEE